MHDPLIGAIMAAIGRGHEVRLRPPDVLLGVDLLVELVYDYPDGRRLAHLGRLNREELDGLAGRAVLAYAISEASDAMLRADP